MNRTTRSTPKWIRDAKRAGDVTITRYNPDGTVRTVEVVTSRGKKGKI